MKNKLFSRVLALIMTLSLIASQSTVFAYNNNDNKVETGTSSVASKFLAELGDKYTDEQQVTVILQINDDVMQSKYGLEAVDMTMAKDDKNKIAAQVAYAQASRQHLTAAFDQAGFNYQVTETYDVALNGLAIETTVATAKAMAEFEEVALLELNKTMAQPEIKKVQAFYTMDESSNKMIKVEAAKALGYTGKHQLIAVLDSGADPDHNCFKAVPDPEIADAAALKTLLKDTGVETKGKYYNEKIPYGYNYAGRNTNIKELDRASSHGMHVAGIIAANNDGKEGVAPDAQLAIMRVFDGPMLGRTTTGKVYNKAIDDAVKLGADSMNMSLGSVGHADKWLSEGTTKALLGAQEAGVLVAISAGNDSWMGEGLLDGPDADNPNYGLVGVPSVIESSLSVASVNNTHYVAKAIVVEGDDDLEFHFQAQNFFQPPTEYTEYVFCGEGLTELDQVDGKDYGKNDFDGKDLKGKIALISRGHISFFNKVMRAQKRGAVAVIIYNSKDKENGGGVFGMNFGPDVAKIRIPVYALSKEDGLVLKDTGKKIKVNDKEEYVANENTGYGLSDFSSWGITEDGNLKPDISAPGGKIYSSINNNLYKIMSGTSMAAPHVAGGIALVKQRVEKDFPDATGIEKYYLVKNLLMSTATPHIFEDGVNRYGSPRGQGAGLMSLNKALTSEVIVVDTNKKEKPVSSINLHSIEGNKVVVEATLKNLGTKERVFWPKAVLSSDKIEKGHVTLEPKLLSVVTATSGAISFDSNYEVAITSGTAIKVPAKTDVDVSVTFTLSQDQVDELAADMPNGYFLEGYVFFAGVNDSNKETVDVNIPFVGFQGVGDIKKWQDLPILEKSIYDMDENYTPMYYDKWDALKSLGLKFAPFTHFIGVKSTANGVEYPILGAKTEYLQKEVDGKMEEVAETSYDKEHIAISPNGDGNLDSMYMIGTYLRDFEKPGFKIYRKEDTGLTSPIYTYETNEEYMRSYFSRRDPANVINLGAAVGWNGENSNGKKVVDGEYLFVYSAKAVIAGGKTETTTFPVKVDTVAPILLSSSYDKAKGELSNIQFAEDLSGIKEYYVVEMIDGGVNYYDPKDGTIAGLKDLAVDKLFLVARDYANNTALIPFDDVLKPSGKCLLQVEAVAEDEFVVDAGLYSYEVFNDKGEQVIDTDKMDSGKYTLKLKDVDKSLKAVEEEVEFEIKAGQKNHLVVLKFKYTEMAKLRVEVNNPDQAMIDLYAVDKKDKKYKLLNAVGSNEYAAYVPAGEYEIVIEKLNSDDYYALVNPATVNVELAKEIESSTVTIAKKTDKEMTLKLKRDGYTGEADITLVGRDYFKTEVKTVVEAGKDSVELKVPHGIIYDAYTKLPLGANYGAKKTEVFFNKDVDTFTITLVKDLKSDKAPVDTEELEKLLADVKKLKEADYTARSWSVLSQAVNEAKTILADDNKTQAQVDEALKHLKEAKQKLVAKIEGADMEALKAKIAEAKAKLAEVEKEGGYIPETVQMLKLKIAAAETILHSDDSFYNNPQRIKKAIKGLDDAMNGLIKLNAPADKELLQKSVSLLENMKAAGDAYVYDKAVFEEVLKVAKAVLDNPYSTQQEIDAAVEKVKELLPTIKANKKALETAVAEVEKMDLSAYIPNSVKVLQEALANAKAVLADENAKVADVQQALKQLEDAKKGLIKKADKTALETAVAEAEKINLPAYTDESVKVFKEALDNAKAVLADENAQEADVQKALKQLEDAQKALTEKPKLTPPKDDTDSDDDSNSDNESTPAPSDQQIKQENEKQDKEKQDNEKKDKEEKEKEEKPKQVEVTIVDGKLASDGKVLEDTKADAWYASAVEYVLENNIMVGTSESSFSPEKATTRAMLTTILHRLSGDQDVSTDNDFNDVDANQWYASGVNWAVANNITAGLSEMVFGPDQELTREQLVTMVYRYAQYKKYNTEVQADLTKFKDSSEVSAFAVEAMQWAVENDIISGVSADQLAPKAGASRAEMAAIINRLIKINN